MGQENGGWRLGPLGLSRDTWSHFASLKASVMSTASVPCHYVSLHALISSPIVLWDTYNEGNTEQGLCQWNRPLGPARLVTHPVTRRRMNVQPHWTFKTRACKTHKQPPPPPVPSLQIHNWLRIKALSSGTCRRRGVSVELKLCNCYTED